MATEKKKSGATRPGETPMIAITQIRSGCQAPKGQKACLRGIGLRRIRHTVLREDTPDIRGMILKVRHLVTVGPADGKA
jgi:large subunit ribosomal protein L30